MIKPAEVSSTPIRFAVFGIQNPSRRPLFIDGHRQIRLSCPRHDYGVIASCPAQLRRTLGWSLRGAGRRPSLYVPPEGTATLRIAWWDRRQLKQGDRDMVASQLVAVVQNCRHSRGSRRISLRRSIRNDRPPGRLPLHWRSYGDHPLPSAPRRSTSRWPHSLVVICASSATAAARSGGQRGAHAGNAICRPATSSPGRGTTAAAGARGRPSVSPASRPRAVARHDGLVWCLVWVVCCVVRDHIRNHCWQCWRRGRLNVVQRRDCGAF